MEPGALHASGEFVKVFFILKVIRVKATRKDETRECHRGRLGIIGFLEMDITFHQIHHGRGLGSRQGCFQQVKDA